MKTRDYLEAVCARKGKNFTAYGLEKSMQDYKWSATTATNYMKGKTFPNQEHALDIAEVLDLDGGLLIADIEKERAEKKGSKRAAKAWNNISKQLRNTAACLVAGTAMMMASPGDALAAGKGQFFLKLNDNIHYAHLRAWITLWINPIKFLWDKPIQAPYVYA